jgi:hypothetical protein
MTHLLADPRYAQGAARIQTGLLAENGVSRTVQVIGRYLS